MYTGECLPVRVLSQRLHVEMDKISGILLKMNFSVGPRNKKGKKQTSKKPRCIVIHSLSPFPLPFRGRRIHTYCSSVWAFLYRARGKNPKCQPVELEAKLRCEVVN